MKQFDHDSQRQADHATCVLCGSVSSSVIRGEIRNAHGCKVHKCSQCGLVFLSPYPTDKELQAYYAGRYVEEYSGISPLQRFADDRPEATRRVERLSGQLSKKIRLLEVGCGSGAFLEAIRDHVGEVRGIEPSRESREWIETTHNIKVSATLDEVVQRGETFDLVVLFHVLEHVNNPIVFLRDISKVIARAGALVVEVPNVNDALLKRYEIEAFADYYFSYAHLIYFSPESLRRCLREAGFDENVQGVQRYDLSNHMHWMRTGKPGGQGMYDDVFSEPLRHAYATSLINAGYADTLWAAVKLAR